MIATGILAVLLTSSPAVGEDLSALYPATLDFVKKDEDRVGHDWETGPEHVWKLRSFEYEIEDKLEIKVSNCDLVIGHSDGNAIWAFIRPERSSKISSTIGGDGEEIQDIWVRFNPAQIGEVFPSKTLRGRGDPDALFWAYRSYPYKINGLWGRAGLPTVPSMNTLVLDIDTEDGKRRVYDCDMQSKRVKALSGYLTNGAPKLESLRRSDAVGIVEGAWKAMDKQYVGFDLSPEIDWAEVLELYRKDATRAKSAFEAGIVVRKMFDMLNDEDLYVFANRMVVTRDQFTRQYNASWQGLNHIIGTATWTEGRDTVWARTPHDVGYINLLAFGGSEHDKTMVEQFDEVLDQLADTWALIIDLRYTRSGHRETAEAVVGRFLKEEQPYGFAQERNGEAHDAFGEPEPLVCEARGSWTYEAPIYLLLGPGTQRDGEQLALMLLRAPQAITMGSPTSGLAANLGRVDLEGGVRILMATSRDLDLDGKVLASVGIEPEVPIEFDESEFTSDNDPVIYRVLEEVLKTTADKRLPANRNAEGASPAVEADAAEESGE